MLEIARGDVVVWRIGDYERIGTVEVATPDEFRFEGDAHSPDGGWLARYNIIDVIGVGGRSA